MCYNRCACAISKCTNCDRQSHWELADEVMEGNCVGWRQERRRSVTDKEMINRTSPSEGPCQLTGSDISEWRKVKYIFNQENISSIFVHKAVSHSSSWFHSKAALCISAWKLCQVLCYLLFWVYLIPYMCVFGSDLTWSWEAPPSKESEPLTLLYPPHSWLS